MTEQTRTEPLDRLAELEEAATPAYWFRQGTLINGPDASGIDVGPLLMDVYSERDAALIAALRNAAPSLITEAREAARLRSAAEAVVYANDHSPFQDGLEHAIDLLRAALVKP